jgi:hypothetical protein
MAFYYSIFVIDKYCMKYKYKYVPGSKRVSNKVQGRPVNPDKWITGPCELTHDKYYAWLKHKAQAKFRGEDYQLSWDDWQSIWSDDDFLLRGRSKESLCLQKIDLEDTWNKNNVIVAPRYEYLKRAKEYRDNDRS